jgi:ElaB/YqjD/DUF883 family membrane-anchored ribosome-binding protein
MAPGALPFNLATVAKETAMTEHKAESNGGRASDAVTGSMGKMKDQLSAVADQADDKFNGARHSAADKLQGAARTVRRGGDAVAGAAHGAAEKLTSTASYLKGHDARRMARDLMEIVKKYPGRAVLLAGVLGFFVARAVRRRS